MGHLSSAAMPLYFHPLYTDGIAPEARFPRERYRRIAARLAKITVTLSRSVTRPRRRESEISIAHDPTYVARFLSGQMERRPRDVGSACRPWTDLIIPRTRHLIGGAIAALTDVVRDGGIAANMAGGTHHAHYDWGAGYCVFNDLAICARLAVQRLRHRSESLSSIWTCIKETAPRRSSPMTPRSSPSPCTALRTSR